MKQKLFLGIGVGISILLTGCTTVMNGPNQQIYVNSNKPNIKFKLDKVTYTTPAVITLERKNKDRVIQVNDKKCKQTIHLKRKIDPKFTLNILNGALFGSTTDYITQDMWEYQDNINIKCK